MTPRRLDAGAAVAAVGAVLLLVSLFLDWYGDGDDSVTAWTVFEVIDLLLAGLALLALSTFLRSAAIEQRLPDAPLPAIGAVATVIVVSQLVNDPPRVAGIDAQLESGAWLALAAAALLLAGALMSVARVSLAVSVEHREPAAAPPEAPEPEPASPEAETVKLDPRDRPA